MPPLIVIGFIAYIYKLLKTNYIKKPLYKNFLLSLILFSLITTYTHEFFTVQYVSLTRRQVGGAIWYSEHTEDRNVIVTEFGLNYMFMYYDYPYNQGDKTLRGRHIHHFVDARDDDLFKIKEDDNAEKLQELKEDENTDVVITPDDQYYLNNGWETYGYLSEDDKQDYYEAHYLNKIYSAKTESGEENSYYWVI